MAHDNKGSSQGGERTVSQLSAFATDSAQPREALDERADTEPSGDAKALVDRVHSAPTAVPRSMSDTATDAPDDERTQISPSTPPPASRRRRPPTVSQRMRDRHRRDPRIGATLAGRYRLERLIAKGGMGRVYLATQLPLDRPVAVKVLKHEFQETDPNFVRRFFLEASTCARLTHPNVVTVHDYGECEETNELFMTMEYLDGVPLSYAIGKGGPMVAERVLNVGIQIGRALREAHEAGIVHRDLKPGNVMLMNSDEELDRVKVLDFGLVKLTGQGSEDGFGKLEEEDLTKSGTLLGSPRYMSPEQIRGDPLDPRTDIYSLGVILYQMAAGRPPFTGETSVDVIYKHLHEPPPPIESVTYAVDCPPELELIIQNCLAKDRDARIQNMGEVVKSLKIARRLILGGAIGASDSSAGAGPYDSSGAVAPGASLRPGSEIGIAVDLTQAGPLDPPDPTPIQEPIVEAAFADSSVGIQPSSGILRDRTAVAETESKRGLLLALAFGLVMLMGAGVVLLGLKLNKAAPPTPSAAPEQSAEPPKALKTRVRFTSDPDGATVTEGGMKIGVTPFEAKLLPTKQMRTFVFQLEGHESSRVQSSVEGTRMALQASLGLRPMPEGEAPEVQEEKPERRDSNKRQKNKRARKNKRKKRARDVPADQPNAEPEKKTPDHYRDNPY